MIVIQRVRVRWTPATRGAPHADARRGLDQPVPLPSPLPTEELVVHEVLLDEVTGYTPQHEVTHSLDRLDLGLTLRGAELVVEALPAWVAYPRRGRARKLFRLAPGEVGRFRANFRLTGCQCSARWWYESWTVHVSHGPVSSFGPTRHDVDERVSLYGRSALMPSRACAH